MQAVYSLNHWRSQVVRCFTEFSKDIKLVHSVFALPFAAAVLFIEAWQWPSVWQIFLMIICMVTARSFAMGMNRLLDRRIDALNPRTMQRSLPAGRLTPRQGLSACMVSAVIFVFASFQLSTLAGQLSVPLLAILGAYPLMKHLGWWVHWYLGACLGLAPVAVIVALGQPVTAPVLLLATAICFWTAGFDIIYSLQDMRFDQAQRLQSIPAKLGAKGALIVSRLSFVLTVVALALVGWLAALSVIYYVGVLIVAAILAWEHWLVRDTDANGYSKNTGPAFLNLNAAVSIVYLCFAALDLVMR